MLTKKNVSNCSGLSLEQCNSNKKCMYVNGDTRKYCKQKAANKNCKYINGKTRKYCKKNTKRNGVQIVEDPLVMPMSNRNASTRSARTASKPMSNRNASTRSARAQPMPMSNRIARVRSSSQASNIFSSIPSSTASKIHSVDSQLSPIQRSNSSLLATNDNLYQRSFESQKGDVFNPVTGNLLEDSPTERIESFNGLNLQQLISVCPNSGECMAIGREKEAIREFFGGFTTFENVEYPIKQIGATSVNGFIKEIKYTKQGYSSYALLKSSQNVHSDNLAYEYEVGLFINKVCNRLPCFVRTYELYYYKSDIAYELMKNYKTTYNILENILEKENGTINYGKACENALYIALLTEHLDNAITLKDLYEQNKSNQDFLTHELPQILFQVYYGLAVLANEQSFTHYDLHWSNVLLYELPESKYVNFEYTSLQRNTPSISFQSRYIAKIIDYGRSYFRDRETGISSLTIRSNLCRIKECEKTYPRTRCEENTKKTYNEMMKKYKSMFTSAQYKQNMNEHIRGTCDKLCGHVNCSQKCGLAFGFPHLNNGFDDIYLNSTVSNRSYDLKLLWIFTHYEPVTTLDELKKKLHYVPNHVGEMISAYPNSIFTVVDAENALEDYITRNPRPINMAIYSVGTIIVDSIDELQYIPNV
jgi:hypothetical protein